MFGFDFHLITVIMYVFATYLVGYIYLSEECCGPYDKGHIFIRQMSKFLDKIYKYIYKIL